MKFKLLVILLVLTIGITNAVEISVKTVPENPSVGNIVIVVNVYTQNPIENANLLVSGLVKGSVSLGNFVGKATAEFKAHVDTPGIYDLDVMLSYNENGSKYLRCVKKIIVRDKPSFEIKSLKGSVKPGSIGKITLEIVNTGGDAKNVKITLKGVLAKDSERFYRFWRGGAVKDLTYSVFVGRDTEVGELGAELNINCTDPYGNRYSYSLPFSISVVGAPKLVISFDTPKIYPDTNFTLHMTVENVGFDRAKDVVVRLNLPKGFSGDDVAYLGEIKRDESKTVEFNLKVSKNVTENRVISVDIESGNLSWNYDVPIYVFPIEPIRIDISGVYTIPNEIVEGSTFTLNLAVENSGKTVAKGIKIDLKLPKGLEGRDTYFIGTLESGDSATSSFVLKADKAGRYVVEAVITYLDPTLTEHTVKENFTLYVFPSQNYTPIIAIAVLTILGVGYWLWRRS